MSVSGSHGRARVDPEHPVAFAICDRCGAVLNRTDLLQQHQWRGSALHNLRLAVCEDCLDRPSMFLRATVLPVDPGPIFNARPEPYTIDEANVWTLVGPPGLPGAIQMRVRTAMAAELTQA